MNTAILDRTKRVKAASPQGGVLTMVPICGDSSDQPPYRLLEATVLGSVTVTEVTTAGSVPNLKVTNTLDVRVLLLDGQELVGAKQNRILNTDVLVPAKKDVIIPVSCVEQGRWHSISTSFAPGKSAGYRTRSRKQERVHASLRESGRHDADQGAVWDEVAESIHAAEATSGTSALADAYKRRETELASFRQSLRMPEDAVGLAVFRDERFLGLDLFDRHSTLTYFWESLVDSYLLDLDATAQAPRTGRSGPLEQQFGEILTEAASGEWEAFETPGEGRDWRHAQGRFVGSALVWEDTRVLHLQLFPRQGQPRIHRPYFRTPRASP